MTESRLFLHQRRAAGRHALERAVRSGCSHRSFRPADERRIDDARQAWESTDLRFEPILAAVRRLMAVELRGVVTLGADARTVLLDQALLRERFLTQAA